MESFSLILLGATGDLAKLKIIPAIYELKKRHLLPDNFHLIGNGRTSYTHEEFRNYVINILENKLNSSLDVKVVKEILDKTFYLAGDLTNDTLYKDINQFLESLIDQGHECGNRVFHLAILPQLYETVIEQLAKHNLAESECGWIRVLIEKPFGQNLTTAQKLDRTLKKHFEEEQIYRIDHYLAKETVQNILAFRFANELFEPTLNNTYVDHIQISMLEDFGIKSRGKFYDRTGTVRDVVQNHLLQVLATVTMDRPETLTAKFIRQQRQKLLTSLSCPQEKSLSDSVVKGQYLGYLQEKDVAPDSHTETYVALKAYIENKRWKGVPFYLRAGKSLCRQVTEVNIVFKDAVMKPSPNVLTFRIQPDESIVLRFFVTKPGPTDELQPAHLQFHYHQLGEALMDAYERVLLDAFRGNQTLFTMAQGVEAEWKFIDPILDYWQEHHIKPYTYAKGSWGPKEADQMIKKDGREWIEPSVDLYIDS